MAGADTDLAQVLASVSVVPPPPVPVGCPEKKRRAGGEPSKKNGITIYTSCKVCRGTDMCSGKAPYCKADKKSIDAIVAGLKVVDQKAAAEAEAAGVDPPPSKLKAFEEMRDSEESAVPPSALSRFVEDFEHQSPSKGKGDKRPSPDWTTLMQRHCTSSSVASQVKMTKMHEKQWMHYGVHWLCYPEADVKAKRDAQLAKTPEEKREYTG